MNLNIFIFICYIIILQMINIFFFFSNIFGAESLFLLIGSAVTVNVDALASFFCCSCAAGVSPLPPFFLEQLQWFSISSVFVVFGTIVYFSSITFAWIDPTNPRTKDCKLFHLWMGRKLSSLFSILFTLSWHLLNQASIPSNCFWILIAFFRVKYTVQCPYFLNRSLQLWTEQSNVSTNSIILSYWDDSTRV